MPTNIPPAVRRAGRSAAMTSASGLALVSLSRQNATSSPIALTAVIDRIVLNEAGLTTMSTRLLRLSVSAVSFSTSPRRRGTLSKTPRHMLKNDCACFVLAARTGSCPRSPGASTAR